MIPTFLNRQCLLFLSAVSFFFIIVSSLLLTMATAKFTLLTALSSCLFPFLLRWPSCSFPNVRRLILQPQGEQEEPVQLSDSYRIDSSSSFSSCTLFSFVNDKRKACLSSPLFLVCCLCIAQSSFCLFAYNAYRWPYSFRAWRLPSSLPRPVWGPSRTHPQEAQEPPIRSGRLCQYNIASLSVWSCVEESPRSERTSSEIRMHWFENRYACSTECESRRRSRSTGD